MGGGVRQVQSWLTCNTRCGAHIGARPRSSSVALGLVYKLSESFPFYFSLVFSSFHHPLPLSISLALFYAFSVLCNWNYVTLCICTGFKLSFELPIALQTAAEWGQERQRKREGEGERGTIACPLWHACLTLLLRLTERRWQLRTLTSAFEWRMKSFSIVARSKWNEKREKESRQTEARHTCWLQPIKSRCRLISCRRAGF